MRNSSEYNARGGNATGAGGGGNAGTLAVLQRCRLVQNKDIKRFRERADSVLDAVTEATEKLTEIARKLERDVGAPAEEGQEERKKYVKGDRPAHRIRMFQSLWDYFSETHAPW